MSDKELLEFAAKAAALPECGWMGPAFMYVKNNTFTDWNPLTYDGDAFRLAVKLNLIVHKGFVYTPTGKLFDNRSYTNPTAATRRAIVRAAAEIGKAMP